jgi:phosphoribosylformylglycinamidine synthase
LKARILVYPRPEILDPQGEAVKNALARVGFPEVEAVRVGKSFDVELGSAGAEEARQRLQEMCRKLLANPVVEDFSVELLDGGGVAEEEAPAAAPPRRSRRAAAGRE